MLKGEPAASEIRPILDRGDAVMHPLNLAETIDRVARLTGADPDDIEADVAILGIETVDPVASILVDAGHWRARHYHHTDRPVSLADCVAGRTAVEMGIELATSDEHCARVVTEEGGSVLALPDSKGRRPAL